MVDKVFYESEKRIADLVMKENTNEPLEFISIRKRIQQINQRIDELSAMLRGRLWNIQGIIIEKLLLMW